MADDETVRGEPVQAASLQHVRTGIKRRPTLPMSGRDKPRVTAYEKKRAAAKAKRGGKRKHGRPRGR